MIDKNSDPIFISDFDQLFFDEPRISFMLKLTDHDIEYKLSFDVYEVVAWDSNGVPSDVELYLTGSIKWDGCSHIWFGDDECYLHLCGFSSWRSHIRLMSEIFEFAKETIKNFNDEVAGVANES